MSGFFLRKEAIFVHVLLFFVVGTLHVCTFAHCTNIVMWPN